MENLFTDLIPKDTQNQFIDLVPQETNEFSDIIPGFKEKAIEFLTAGHIPARPIIEPTLEEFRERPELQAEYAPERMGIFEDPVFMAGMGLAHGARVAGQAVAPMAMRLARGAVAAGREAVGWMTGGVSDIPALAKMGLRGGVKAIEAARLAKLREARLAGTIPERFAEVPIKAVIPEKGFVEGAIKAGEKAVPGTIEKAPWDYTVEDLVSGDRQEIARKLERIFGPEDDFQKWHDGSGKNLKRHQAAYDLMGNLEYAAATRDLPEVESLVKEVKKRMKPRDYYDKKGYEIPETKGKPLAAQAQMDQATREISATGGITTPPDIGIAALAAEQRQIAQAGKIIIALGKKEVKPTYSFAAPETEALFQSAKGIHPGGIIEKIKNVATEVGHKFTRDFEHLVLKKENAQLIFDLKRLEKQKDVVADRTVRSIGETLSGLSKADYNIFSRKVILDDLMSDYSRGLYKETDLPFKFTPESLSAEIGKLDALIGTNPKVGEALTKRQGMWDQVKSEYVDALSPYKTGVEDMFKENYYRHQVLDYVLNNGIFGTGKRLRAPIARGYMKGRTGYSGLYNTDYLEAEHQIMAQMLHDVETAKTLTKIQAGEDIVKEIRAQAKADGLPDWHKATPEGYTTWQPKEGNVFYPVLTVNEKTAERIMTGQMDEILEGGGQIFRDALAVGGKRKEWVVRNEVADTLDNLVRERAKGLISSADLGVMTAWKKWQLISPRRYFKYNTRNLTGDAEAVFLGNISGFKKALQAVKELGEVFFQKKSMSPDMTAWFERGGMSSTLQAQEMDVLRPMWMFSRLHEKKVGDLNLWNKYWNGARLTTDFRESILRYANFLDYKSQLMAGKGIPKNYGASKPEMINALKDIDDKAYWLSNDLLGAYDRVGVAGQVIRERLIPFWSWQEVNFKRYVQLYKNAANDGDLATTVGKQLGAKTAITALKVGRLAIKTAAFASMLQVYNHTFFPEEEKILPTDMKSTPHMIFGRDDKGNIQYFNRMGTLDDFISWFGLDYAPRFVGEYLDGKKSMKELLQAQAKKTYEAPVNKVIQGAAPFTKLLAETISRTSTFPDVFQPGTVRDRWHHIARSVGLENEYNLMAGKPSKGYGESLKNLFIYKIDPGEAAFRDVYDMKSNFMKKLGRTSEGFWLTPTGDALYNMKLSIKYDDKEAFSKYLTEYVTLASAQKKTKEQIQQGIKTSIQTMHPLYGMNEKLKTAFIGSLNFEDQGTLAQSIEFYNKTLRGEQ